MRHPLSLLSLVRGIRPASWPAAVGLIAVLGPTGAAGQSPALETALAPLELREIGPAVMGGRVSDLAVVEGDSRTFYVGYASGGLWRTDSHGRDWTPLFDDQRTASIGAVSLAPSNPNVVWVGTGEPQNRQSSPYGAGVFKSLDRGDRWQFMGLEETRHVARIVVHPTDPDVVYVAAMGHLWGSNEERGVYRSTDGGRTWERSLYIDEHTGAIDLVIDRNDPSTLFAAMYQRQRTPWGYSADGTGSGIYRTLDGGERWQEMTHGLPDGDKGRIGLDIYRGDGSLVYAIVEADEDGRGLYRSQDRGATWERVSTRNPRPMYFSLVRIDPSNPERIYLGGVQLSISDDGGRTWWEGDAARNVHLDHHALWVDPDEPGHVIDGNDGGVATSRDGGRHWVHHHNVAAGQFYQIDVDSRDPYWICGGLQDNNSWCGPSRTLEDSGRMDTPGPRNRHWNRVWGGDGFWNVIDPTNPEIVFSESQNGRFGRFHRDTGESAQLQPVLRPGERVDADYRWHWNTPLLLSSHDPATLYAGANHLLRTRDRGHTWEEASPDLTRRVDRDTIPIMGAPVDENTLSRNDGTSDYGTITEIGESPIDADVLYAGTDDGKLWGSRDGGTGWTDLTGAVPGLVHGMTVSGIEASRHVAGRVYLAFDGHRNDDYRPYVAVSDDFGESWRMSVDGLPDDASVNTIREHPRTPSLLFVGNEVGAYLSVDGGGRWSRLTGNFPTVPVDDLRIHPRDNDLVIGTHGRSIWVLDDIGPLEEIANGDVLARSAVLFSGQRGTMWRLSPGPWFHPGSFVGDDPAEGATLRYWLRDDLDGPARLEIYEGDNEILRRIEGPGTPGIQQAVWDFGIVPPARESASSGPPVLPGTYQVRLIAGTDTAEAEVAVRQDPRIEVPRAILAERQAALERLYRVLWAVDEADERVEAARERIEAAGGVLERADDEAAPLLARADTAGQRLSEISEALDEADPGGRLGSAIQGIRDRPTVDQMAQLDRGEERAVEVIRDLNSFLADDLATLEEAVYQPTARPVPLDPVTLPDIRPVS